jgi:hypothetical protein
MFYMKNNTIEVKKLLIDVDDLIKVVEQKGLNVDLNVLKEDRENLENQLGKVGELITAKKLKETFEKVKGEFEEKNASVQVSEVVDDKSGKQEVGVKEYKYLDKESARNTFKETYLDPIIEEFKGRKAELRQLLQGEKVKHKDLHQYIDNLVKIMVTDSKILLENKAFISELRGIFSINDTNGIEVVGEIKEFCKNVLQEAINVAADQQSVLRGEDKQVDQLSYEERKELEEKVKKGEEQSDTFFLQFVEFANSSQLLPGELEDFVINQFIEDENVQEYVKNLGKTFQQYVNDRDDVNPSAKRKLQSVINQYESERLAEEKNREKKEEEDLLQAIIDSRDINEIINALNSKTFVNQNNKIKDFVVDYLRNEERAEQDIQALIKHLYTQELDNKDALMKLILDSVAESVDIPTQNFINVMDAICVLNPSYFDSIITAAIEKYCSIERESQSMGQVIFFLEKKESILKDQVGLRSSENNNNQYLEPVLVQPVVAPQAAQPVVAPQVVQPVVAPQVVQPVVAPQVVQPVVAPQAAQPVVAPQVANRNNANFINSYASIILNNISNGFYRCLNYGRSCMMFIRDGIAAIIPDRILNLFVSSNIPVAAQPVVIQPAVAQVNRPVQSNILDILNNLYNASFGQANEMGDR